MNKKVKIMAFIGTLLMIILAAACSGAGTDTGGGMKKIAEKKAGSVMVTLSNADGQLKNGEQEIMLTFSDLEGKPLEIKAASLNFNMPAMGSMAEMNDTASLHITSTPGQFKGKVNIEMKGEWTAQISFEGAETGQTTIPTTAY